MTARLERGAHTEVSIDGTPIEHIPLHGRPQFAGMAADADTPPIGSIIDGALVISTDTRDIAAAYRDAFAQLVNDFDSRTKAAALAADTTQAVDAAVENWNRRHPIGTPVTYWPGERRGEGKAGRTGSGAWVLAGQAVVSVDGHADGLALTHVEVTGGRGVMSPMEEIATAAKRLYDLRDDVSLYTEIWDALFDAPIAGLPRNIAAFIKAMSPVLALALADWLQDWEGFEFREDGPMPDDLKAALAIARAVNGGAR